MSKQPLHSESRIEVPPHVAVCPYCDAPLSVSFTGFEENDDGTCAVDLIETECPNEPDLDSDEWEDWYASHSDMPYVYQLPVEMKIIKWLNETYIFDLEGER